MSELLCKFCGNDDFKMVNETKALCKYCYRFTFLKDEQRKKLKIKNENFDQDQNQNWMASVIMKVSLLKRAIDESLDKRDKKEFDKLTSILKVYQQFLQTQENSTPVPSKKGLKQPR